MRSGAKTKHTGFSVLLFMMKFFTTKMVNRRHFKKKTFLAIILAGILFFFSSMMFKEKITYDLDFEKTRLDSLAGIDEFNASGQVCVHPILNLYDKKIMKYFYPINCVDSCLNNKKWIEVSNGFGWINPDILKKYPEVQCEIKYILRQRDFDVVLSDTVIKLDYKNPKFELLEDFFQAYCKTSSWNLFSPRNNGVYAGISKKQYARGLNYQNGLELDVLMIGIDSLSQLAFRRTLPKVVEYFVNNLQGTVLNGYNIVGDGTPQALIPILTGKTELQLPSVLKSSPNDSYVNIYPFIWNAFKKRGYVTAYAEDQPDIGTFQYRMKGFDEQPTDHYLRPLYLKVGTNKCVGNYTKNAIFFRWIREFYHVYKAQRKFMFAFASEHSHDDNNRVQCIENELLSTFTMLNDEGHLKNSLVVIFADHGARFSKHRSFLQGKQEERRPFFGISVPESLKQRMINIKDNLKINSHRLTSPFDIYKTLENVLNLSGMALNSDGLGQSLFQEIPKERKCTDVGIDTHWCACLEWNEIDIQSKFVQRASKEFVMYLNKLILPYIDLCHTIGFLHIISAHSLSPSDKMLKFKQSKDIHGRNADFTDNTRITTEIYQLTLVTSPNDAKFEVTFSYLHDEDTFIFRERSISRINKYGHSADCINQVANEDLRKYCSCNKGS